MTLLSLHDPCFSALDLRGIRIPGANLSGALLDHTQLQGSDLRGVNLQGAWLRNADFRGAQMDDVNFGFPSILPKIPDFHWSPGGVSYCMERYWLAVSLQLEVNVYDVAAQVV